MRPLIFITDAFGGHGGIAKFNRDLLNALLAAPTVESVTALPRLIPDPSENPPPRLDWRTRAASGKCAFVRELLRLFFALRGPARPTHLICGHLNLLPLAVLAKRRWRIPLWQIIHGIEAWEATATRKPSPSALRHIDRLLSVSQFTRDRFTAWTNATHLPWTWLPNSIDLDRFSPGPRDPQLVSRYNLAGRTVLLTLCRHSASERYKGVDEILDLLPSFGREIPHLTYLLCGNGDDLPRLIAKARSLGLGVQNLSESPAIQPLNSSASRQFSVSASQHLSISALPSVIFTGRIPESEKVSHYRLADAFALPGRGEGFGIVYLEAIACGLPVVASTADASQEVIRHCHCGETVNPDDPADLRRGLLAALTTPTRPSRTQLEIFSWASFYNRISDLVTSVAG